MTLPRGELEAYRAGARRLREAIAGGEVTLQEVKYFWREMLNGRCLTVIYGSTETGMSPFRTEDSMDEV